MNTYKMITICSLSIVFILILSLLLPLTTKANDKEKVELNLNYADSKVIANIIVNSESYSGVICKYIAVDNILEYDNLEEKTKDEGTNLNVSKSEENKYNATIQNINKRYIVVYVSIGDYSICDYIDCNTEKSENSNNLEKQESNTNIKNENINQIVNEVEEKDVNMQTVNNANGVLNNKTIANTESNKTITNTDSNETIANTESNKSENIVQSDNNIIINNSNSALKIFNNNKRIEEDLNSFEEIKTINTVKKANTTTTVKSKMPQTGENDTIKIMGIIIFSIIGVLSYYKYKTTK